MAWLWGSEEQKTVENTGGVTNKVVIGGRVDIINIEMMIMIGIICGIKIFETISYIYRRHYQNVKKRCAQPV